MKRIDELKDIIKGKKAAEAPKAPERELPEPGDMSMSLTEVLMRRRSSLDFSDAPICDEDLVRILWAADGLNGKGNNANHRTTPTTLNWKDRHLRRQGQRRVAVGAGAPRLVVCA